MVKAGLYQGWDSGRDCLEFFERKARCRFEWLQLQARAGGLAGGMALVVPPIPLSPHHAIAKKR